MVIILPGYDVFILNQVFAKDSLIDPNIDPNLPNGNLLPAKELIWLSKYAVPFEEEVVSYLQQKIQKIESLVGSNIKLQQLSELEQALTNLSRDARTMIKTNQEDILGQLIENIPIFADRESLPQHCLQVGYGLALTEVLDNHAHKISSPDWHPGHLFSLTNKYGSIHGSRMVIREEPIEKWVAFLTLDGDVLPKKVIINSLLNFGSAVSDHLQIWHSGIPYVNYSKIEVKSVLDAVYKGLSGRAADVTDSSKVLLDQITLDLLEPLLITDHLQKQLPKQPIEDDDDSVQTVPLFGSDNKPGKDKPN